MSEKIRSAIKRLAGKQAITAFTAKVKSVDKEKATCEVVPIGDVVEILDVRLKALINNDNGLIIYPKKDSIVLVGVIENNSALCYLISCDEIESIKCTVGENFSLSLDNEGNIKCSAKSIEFNDGKNKGVPVHDKIEENLKSIKNYLDNEKTALIAAFNAIGTAMSANGASGATSYQSAMTSNTINFVNMENKDIKH